MKLKGIVIRDNDNGDVILVPGPISLNKALQLKALYEGFLPNVSVFLGSKITLYKSKRINAKYLNDQFVVVIGDKKEVA